MLTGAQKPIGFDGHRHQAATSRDAFTLAASEDMPGRAPWCSTVGIILGTRARKTRTKSFRGLLQHQLPRFWACAPGRGAAASPTCAPDGAAETPVVLRPRSAPGGGPDEADPRARTALWRSSSCRRGHDALIIESFGVGGLPEAGGFYECIRRWMQAGKVIVLTTQVPSEGSDLGVYHVGHALKNRLGVLEAYDMTTEAVAGEAHGRSRGRPGISPASGAARPIPQLAKDILCARLRGRGHLTPGKNPDKILAQLE